MFLGGDLEYNITIHPPGAMHQDRWMARAIYLLKIFLFRNYYNIAESTKKAIWEICVFIIFFMLKLGLIAHYQQKLLIKIYNL
jgi:hypothetical protein